MLSVQTYLRNRKLLADWMKDNSFYICHSGEDMDSGNDECYAFEPYRNFLYLTGITSSNAILLIVKRDNKVREMLFMHIPTPMEQRWMDMKWEPEKLKLQTGIQTIYGLEAFNDVISRILFHGVIQDCYLDVSRYKMDFALNQEQKIANELRQAFPYLTMHNAYPFVCSLRTVKVQDEIDAHRKAVQITEAGVRNMLVNMKPGMYEYEIEAYYDFVLKSNGVRVPAFPTIAASGQNANHMHYMTNNAKTKDGDLILFDLGARYEYYCADVSRTYPVNGKFTERQKQLYNVVLMGLKAAEDAAKPGVVKDELQNLSKHVMAQELIKIGKIQKEEEINRYYMHGSGHFIGLDTHDVGDYDIVLKKDMMFTLEPGLYFDDEETGIRIEDTMLVTDNGIDIFSDSIPKEIDDIESVMAKK